MKTNLDPTNYPAVWNEHRRLLILHDRCLFEMMLALDCEEQSELEEAILAMRSQAIVNSHAMTLERKRIKLEQELTAAEDALALATKLRHAQHGMDKDFAVMEC